MRIILATLFVGLLLCTPSEAARLKAYSGDDAGVVLLSIATPIHYSFYIKRIDEKGGLSVRGGGRQKFDFETPRIVITPEYDPVRVEQMVPGHVHSIKLPPGRYSIERLTVENNIGIVTYGQTIHLGWVFDVGAGKTTYLGALQVAVAYGPGGTARGRDGIGFLGWEPRTANFWERDLAVARRNDPSVAEPSASTLRRWDSAGEAVR